MKGWIALLCLSLLLPGLALAHEAMPQADAPEAAWTLELNADADILTMTLAGNPTTGYTWTVKADPEALVEILESAGEAETDMPGAPSPTIFKISAGTGQEGQGGAVHLHFSYARGWEQDVPAAKEVALDLWVTESGTLQITKVSQPEPPPEEAPDTQS